MSKYLPTFLSILSVILIPSCLTTEIRSAPDFKARNSINFSAVRAPYDNIGTSSDSSTETKNNDPDLNSSIQSSTIISSEGQEPASGAKNDPAENKQVPDILKKLVDASKKMETEASQGVEKKQNNKPERKSDKPASPPPKRSPAPTPLPTATPHAPEPKKEPLSIGEKKVKGVSFENAPLKDVIQTFSELTGIKYVLSDDADPETKITFKYESEEPLSTEDFKKVFQKFMEERNYAVVQKDGKNIVHPTLILQFENSDLREVIHILCELLDIDYILHPAVGAGKKVTVQTWKGKVLSKEEIRGVLLSLMELNGLAFVQAGPYVKIVPVEEVPERPIKPRVPEDFLKELGKEEEFKKAEEFPQLDEMIMQIIPLEHITVDDAANFIKPLLSKKATVITRKETNMMILTEFASNMEKIMKIIELLDVDIGARDFKIFQIIYADANDIANVLQRIFSSKVAASIGTTQPSTIPTRRTLGTAPQAAGKAGEVVIIPDKRSNSIIVFGDKRDIEFAQQMIAILDVDIYATPKTFIYYCENAKAADLAKILSSVFSKTTKQKSGARPAGVLLPRTGVEQPSAAPPSGEEGAGGGIFTSEEITIVPDERTNSLIIVTSEAAYKEIYDLLKKLDIFSKQVLIEILYAEITLTDSNQFGVNWTLLSQGKVDIGGSTYYFDGVAQQALNVPTGGITYNLFEASRFRAFLEALMSDEKLKVISNPHILASNNQSAKIQIGSNIPITSTWVDQQGIARTETQYRKTGIILDITPHINENRYVTLEISQEVSQAGEPETGQTNPPIQTRNIETTVQVKDSMSLVIGGMIESNRTSRKSGVPGLVKIPLLGKLFSTGSSTNINTELIVVITPHVIADPQEALFATDTLWNKSINVKEYYEDNKRQLY